MSVPPEWIPALSTFIASLSSAVLMWASWRWPPGHHRKRDDDEKDEDE